MHKKQIKKRGVLIAFFIIFIFLLSFAIFQLSIYENNSQNEKSPNKTAVSEKQQLYEIITNPNLTNEEKAEKPKNYYMQEMPLQILLRLKTNLNSEE